MQRTEAHDFYLLKAKKRLDLNDRFYHGLPEIKETENYICIDHFWLHDDFIGYISPSFTGLSRRLDYTGVSLITEKEDAEKLIRICEGWIIIIKEMAESVAISNWETRFLRQDLLSNMEHFKCIAEQMRKHNDYVIFHWGI